MTASASAQGRALVDGRRRLEVAESEWFTLLAEFDSSMLWANDGAVGCASWLIANCGMARSTAFEKLRVAHELRRRPLLAEAYAAGRISYSQLRAITAVTDGGVEFDELMLEAALTLTADDLQRAVEYWVRIRNQDRPPPDFDKYRRIRRVKGFGGGLGRVIIDDREENIERLFNFIDAFLEAEDEAAAKEPVDESAAQTEFIPRPGWSQRRVDALNDLIEVAAATNFESIDVERAAIGVTVSYESLITGTGAADLSSGRVITGEAARRLCCDAGLHRIVIRGQSEVLDVGRKTRHWNTAQRRAIRARHNHRCAIKGCNRRVVQIHHIIWWENGGVTSIEVGIPLCGGHHHMVHEGGWDITYDPTTGVTTFISPDRERCYETVSSFTPLPLAGR
jgi:hypothetical protein